MSGPAVSGAPQPALAHPETALGHTAGPGSRFILGSMSWAIFAALLRTPPPASPALAALLAGDDSPRLQPLDRVAAIAGFSCGVPSLDEGLAQDWHNPQPLADPLARRAHVLVEAGRVVGYCALRRCFVARPEAQGTALPVLLLARLAVDRTAQGRRLGQALLREAVRQMADDTAFAPQALVVHALDAGVQSFYLRHGFHPMPEIIDPLGVVVTAAEVRQARGLPG